MAKQNFENHILQNIMYLFNNTRMQDNYYVFNFITVDYLNDLLKIGFKTGNFSINIHENQKNFDEKIQ